VPGVERHVRDGWRRRPRNIKGKVAVYDRGAGDAQGQSAKSAGESFIGLNSLRENNWPDVRRRWMPMPHGGNRTRRRHAAAFAACLAGIWLDGQRASPKLIRADAPPNKGYARSLQG